MIERTTFDLRIAEHNTTTARINQSEWRHGPPARRPIRAALAKALVSLATRLDPARIPAMPGDARSFPAPAA